MSAEINITLLGNIVNGSAFAITILCDVVMLILQRTYFVATERIVRFVHVLSAVLTIILSLSLGLELGWFSAIATSYQNGYWYWYEPIATIAIGMRIIHMMSRFFSCRDIQLYAIVHRAVPISIVILVMCETCLGIADRFMVDINMFLVLLYTRVVYSSILFAWWLCTLGAKYGHTQNAMSVCGGINLLPPTAIVGVPCCMWWLVLVSPRTLSLDVMPWLRATVLQCVCAIASIYASVDVCFNVRATIHDGIDVELGGITTPFPTIHPEDIDMHALAEIKGQAKRWDVQYAFRPLLISRVWRTELDAATLLMWLVSYDSVLRSVFVWTDELICQLDLFVRSEYDHQLVASRIRAILRTMSAATIQYISANVTAFVELHILGAIAKADYNIVLCVRFWQVYITITCLQQHDIQKENDTISNEIMWATRVWRNIVCYGQVSHDSMSASDVSRWSDVLAPRDGSVEHLAYEIVLTHSPLAYTTNLTMIRESIHSMDPDRHQSASDSSKRGVVPFVPVGAHCNVSGDMARVSAAWASTPAADGKLEAARLCMTPISHGYDSQTSINVVVREWVGMLARYSFYYRIMVRHHQTQWMPLWLLLPRPDAVFCPEESKSDRTDYSDAKINPHHILTTVVGNTTRLRQHYRLQSDDDECNGIEIDNASTNANTASPTIDLLLLVAAGLGCHRYGSSLTAFIDCARVIAQVDVDQLVLDRQQKCRLFPHVPALEYALLKPHHPAVVRLMFEDMTTTSTAAQLMRMRQVIGDVITYSHCTPAEIKMQYYRQVAMPVQTLTSIIRSSTGRYADGTLDTGRFIVTLFSTLEHRLIAGMISIASSIICSLAPLLHIKTMNKITSVCMVDATKTICDWHTMGIDTSCIGLDGMIITSFIVGYAIELETGVAAHQLIMDLQTVESMIRLTNIIESTTTQIIPYMLACADQSTDDAMIPVGIETPDGRPARWAVPSALEMRKWRHLKN